MDPGIAGRLARELGSGTIVVTGTNGKTTTTKMLVEALRASGLSVITNDSGSNLARGVTTALVEAAGALGGGVDADVGVFESDELAFPAVARALRPDLVVVTNFLRDQLDRAHEVDRTVEVVRETLATLPDATVVLNADDPLCASLAASCHGRVVFFGLEAEEAGAAEDATTMAHCPSCGEPLAYGARSFGHLGAWSCPVCGETRPAPQVGASAIHLHGDSSAFVLDSVGSRMAVTLAVPALYNVYNAVAAAAAARAMLVLPETIATTFREFTAAFGRMETLQVDGRDVMVLLAKNPVGATQALDAVLRDGAGRHIAFVLNDRAADGRDVSWTWDVALESFDLSGCHIVVSGSRAEDMAVRMKYAGVAPERLTVVPDATDAVRALAASTPAGETAYLLPTYTAMLEIRTRLAPSAGRFSRLGRSSRLARALRAALGGA